jgi:predicted naringenin-chalcone synthase
MGCSAGVISIELVKNMLASKPNAVALVVSTENLTQNLYLGNERGFLLQNTLFRCGGAAIILSNKWTDALRAKLKLLHIVRTQYVSEDSFGCVYETEDNRFYNLVPYHCLASKTLPSPCLPTAKSVLRSTEVCAYPRTL